MGNFLSESIVTRMNAIILPVIAVCLIAVGAVVGTYNYKRIIADLNSTAENTAKLAAISFKDPVWNYDGASMTNVARAIMLDQNVVRLRLIADSGKMLVDEARAGYENLTMETLKTQKDIIYVEQPIVTKRSDSDIARIGVVSIATTTVKAETAIRQGTIFIAIAVTFLILVLSFSVTLSAKKFIKLPLSRLEASADKLASGHLEEKIDTGRGDELGHMSRSFARMRDSIKKQFAELESLNRELDERVKERTKELSVAYNQLQKAQATLVQSEKMASLGQLVAGVAHEINTPLGYVKNNVELFKEVLDEVEEFSLQVKGLVELLVSPQISQAKIDAPLHAIEKFLDSTNEVEMRQRRELVTDSLEGLARISEIVISLRDFSRLDRAKIDIFDVNHGLDSTLKIAQSLLKDRIEVIKNYGEIPKIHGAGSKINQVFLNLITNAAQAIEGEGVIRITTIAKGRFIRIKIADNGVGMPKDILPKICDPFFTTKPVGQGTGLGLSISHSIIEQEHRGKLRFVSEEGKGTIAIVLLPIGTIESTQEVKREDTLIYSRRLES